MVPFWFGAVARDSSTPFANEMVYCTCYVADHVNSDLSEVCVGVHACVCERVGGLVDDREREWVGEWMIERESGWVSG